MNFTKLSFATWMLVIAASCFASQDSVKVVKGQTVKKGDVIGSVSSSAGYEFSDGAHLHLEVAVGGKNVDPMPYVKGEIFREVEQKD